LNRETVKPAILPTATRLPTRPAKSRDDDGIGHPPTAEDDSEIRGAKSEAASVVYHRIPIGAERDSIDRGQVAAQDYLAGGTQLDCGASRVDHDRDRGAPCNRQLACCR